MNRILFIIFTVIMLGLMGGAARAQQSDGGRVAIVSDVGALRQVPSTIRAVVLRQSYRTEDLAFAVMYTGSPSACPLNAGQGDGGWQIPSADGKCWIASLAGGADIRVWGASTAAPDNSEALLAAVRAASQGVGGGRVLIPASSYKIAQKANLDLTAYKNVVITCMSQSTGVQAVSNLNAPCTLRLNPAYSILLGANQQISALRIVNQNVENATSTREAISNAQNFIGTAIIANHDDIDIHDTTINGFNLAFYTDNAQRIRLDNVVGDDTNFISINRCNDTCQFSRLEAWPFTVNGQIPQKYKVAGVTSRGGKFEIAYDTRMGTPLVTGDIVVLHGLGVRQPLGRYRITVVDSSHFTLDDTIYSGGYTSGGYVELSSTRRLGTAFHFSGSNVGGEYLSGLWEYGHDTCMKIDENHGPDDAHYLWCDGDDSGGSLADGETVGIYYAGFGSGIFGGTILNKAVSVHVNSTDMLNRPFTINGVSALAASGCQASDNAKAGAAVDVDRGSILINNTTISGANLCREGYKAFRIGEAAGFVKLSNVILNGTGFHLENPSHCGSVTIDGIGQDCAPSSATAPCAPGQIQWDGAYMYVCVARNTWRRSTLSRF